MAPLEDCLATAAPLAVSALGLSATLFDPKTDKISSGWLKAHVSDCRCATGSAVSGAFALRLVIRCPLCEPGLGCASRV